MNQVTIPATALFRFAVPCHFTKSGWTARGLRLTAAHRLPHCAAIDGQEAWAQLSAGWNPQGLAFRLQVQSKQQPLACDRDKPLESDRLELWIDTRDTHTVHRAGRFCHHFLFLPTGAGRRRDEPLGGILPIARARENPRPVPSGSVQVRSRQQPGGYSLDAWIGAEALTGFDPEEHPRLGFTYAVHDAELGVQTFNCSPELPFASDPSLWATLELLGP